MVFCLLWACLALVRCYYYHHVFEGELNMITALIILAVYLIGAVIGFRFMRVTKEHTPWAIVFAVLWPGIVSYMGVAYVKAKWRGEI